MDLVSQTYMITSAFRSRRDYRDNFFDHKCAMRNYSYFNRRRHVVLEVEGITQEWGNEKAIMIYDLTKEEAEIIARELKQEAYIYYNSKGLWELIHTKKKPPQSFNTLVIKPWADLLFDFAPNWTKLPNGLAFTIQ